MMFGDFNNYYLAGLVGLGVAGIITVSMTWMTPLLALTSGVMTLALLMLTRPFLI
jgi:uncharacterized membrane protein